MIPLTYSFFLIFASFVFAYLFARRFGYDPDLWRTLGQSFAAATIGAFSAYGTLQVLAPLLPTETFFGIFTQGILAAGVGAGVWLLTLYLLKSVELFEVVTIFFRRLKTPGT